MSAETEAALDRIRGEVRGAQPQRPYDLGAHQQSRLRPAGHHGRGRDRQGDAGGVRRLPGPVWTVAVRDHARQRVRGAGQGERLRRAADAAAGHARAGVAGGGVRRPGVGGRQRQPGGAARSHAAACSAGRPSAAEDAGTLFDHPMLRLEVGGRHGLPGAGPDRVPVEGPVPRRRDQVVPGDRRAGRRRRRSRPRRSSPPCTCWRCARCLRSRAFPESAVAHDVVLVCPKDFSNQPTATFVDVRKQLTVLRRQLSRLTRIDALLSLLPPTLSLVRRRGPLLDVAADLREIEARYMPECLNNCELARFCRDEARGCTRALGRSVARGPGRGRDGRDGARAGAGRAAGRRRSRSRRRRCCGWRGRCGQECLGSAA